MTKPTQAQIEAARNEYLNRCGHYKPPSDETFAAIISAAAEVGDDYKPIYDSQNNRVRAAVAATIQRCAQKVYDEFRFKRMGDDYKLKDIIAAIRALADKPQPDPNIIYPGKDLTNVFPEEEP